MAGNEVALVARGYPARPVLIGGKRCTASPLPAWCFRRAWGRCTEARSRSPPMQRTTAQVAALLGCSSRVLENLITNGRLSRPRGRFGRLLAWFEDDVARAQVALSQLRPRPGRPPKARPDALASSGKSN